MKGDYIRNIKIKDGNVDAALYELIECKATGEFAVLEIDEFLINTTDDVPFNFEHMSKEEVMNSIEKAARERYYELRAAKLGISGDNLVEKVGQHDYEEEEYKGSVK